MYRTTRDPKWREIGWDMFQALERYTRYKVGYTSIQFVDQGVPTKINEMPRFVPYHSSLLRYLRVTSSYALAETFKYLYLLCQGIERDPLPMDKWVFNTEAHPFIAGPVPSTFKTNGRPFIPTTTRPFQPNGNIPRPAVSPNPFLSGQVS